MYFRSFAKIMDDAMDIVREHKGDMMLANFVRCIVLTGFIMIFSIIMSILAAVVSSLVEDVDAVFVIMIIIALPVIIAILHAGSGSIILLTNNIYHKKFLTVTMAIDGGLKKLPELFGYAVLEMLGLMPVALVATFLIWAIGGGLNSIGSLDLILDSPIGTLAFILLIYMAIVGSVALLISCYQTFFAFGVVAIVVDGLGPVQALKRNWRLIKHEFKENMGRMVLTWLGLSGVQLCFNMIAALVAMVVGLVCTLAGLEFSDSMLEVVIAIVEWPANIIFSLLFFAIQPAIMTVFYYNQKCKMEGIDLIERLRVMKQSEEESEESEESDAIDLVDKEQVVTIKEIKENEDGADDRIRGDI